MVNKRAHAKSANQEKMVGVQGTMDKAQIHKMGVMHIRHRLLSDAPNVPIDASVAFRLDRDLMIPHRPGVYLIHDLRGVLYVGRSVDLRRRFDEHFWQCENPLLAVAIAQPVGELRFSWHLIGFPAQVTLERQLINYFNPPCNRTLYIMHTLATDRRSS